jgi:hypothetical protein
MDITSGRDPQFFSEVWKTLWKRLIIKHHNPAAFHLQANALAERFNISCVAKFNHAVCSTSKGTHVYIHMLIS